MKKPRPIATLVSAIMLALALVMWIALAPTKLGGQVGYVIVNGNSMEPGMHRGDLAVVRQSHAYAEGDVVTYRHPDIGPVIHRIIGREGERYIFKGDHNSFVDDFKPSQADLVGKLWFHVPSLGRLIAPFQSRRNVVILIAVSLAVLTGGAGTATRRRKARKQAGPEGNAPNRGPATRSPSLSLEEGMGLLCAGAITCLALAVFAFTRPSSRQAPDNISYTQSGAFSYSAASRSGAIYDDATAVTGDPIFRRLSDSVAVQFSYSLASKRPADVGGVQRLVVEISDVGGWKRTIELQPPTPFRGTSFVSEGVLRLAEVDAIIHRFESDTGVHSPSYTVTISPQIDVRGTLGGRELRDTFRPRLALKVDQFQLSLPPRSASGADPVAPTAGGVLRGTKMEANKISLIFVSLGVPMARWIALVGLGIAAVGAGLVAFGLLRRDASVGNAKVRWKAKYGLLVVSVRDVPVADAWLIDVTSAEDLAKVALREGRCILQWTRPGVDGYFVQDGAVVYRYLTTDAVSPSQSLSPPSGASLGSNVLRFKKNRRSKAA